MNTVTGKKISDYIFTDTFNTDALDKLLLALAEGKKNEVDVFLEALRKAAHESVRVLPQREDSQFKSKAQVSTPTTVRCLAFVILGESIGVSPSQYSLKRGS